MDWGSISRILLFGFVCASARLGFFELVACRIVFVGAYAFVVGVQCFLFGLEFSLCCNTCFIFIQMPGVLVAFVAVDVRCSIRVVLLAVVSLGSFRMNCSLA